MSNYIIRFDKIQDNGSPIFVCEERFDACADGDGWAVEHPNESTMRFLAQLLNDIPRTFNVGTVPMTSVEFGDAGTLRSIVTGAYATRVSRFLHAINLQTLSKLEERLTLIENEWRTVKGIDHRNGMREFILGMDQDEIKTMSEEEDLAFYKYIAVWIWVRDLTEIVIPHSPQFRQTAYDIVLVQRQYAFVLIYINMLLDSEYVVSSDTGITTPLSIGVYILELAYRHVAEQLPLVYRPPHGRHRELKRHLSEL